MVTNEIDFHIAIHGAHQIDHERRRTAQYADDQRILVAVFTGQLLAQPRHRVINLFSSYEGGSDILMHRGSIACFVLIERVIMDMLAKGWG